jgi:NAD-dependent dihydropyrimidine dehydrogenase PreA subunit
MQDNLAVVADPEACNYCGYCEPICPVGAIELPYQIVWEDE